MMHNDSIARYCRRVGYYLTCSKEHKKTLLEGFAEELAERKLSDVSVRSLHRVIGSPAETAAQLQSTLDPNEILRTRQRFKVKLAVFVAAFLFAITVGCIVWGHYISSIQPVYYDEYVSEGKKPENDSEIIWIEHSPSTMEVSDP